MRIAVMGGTGRIGSQVVKILNEDGHEAVPHSPSSGVDLLTGQGVPEALDEVDVVVNLTNSPTFDDASPVFFHRQGGRAHRRHHLPRAARAVRTSRLEPAE